MDRKKMIAVTMHDEKADVVLKNARVINVFSNEINRCDVAVSDGFIVGLGSYQGKQTIDLKGKYLAPGFIDGHVHIESSMLTPSGFASLIVPFGTTTIIADPHEIANVCGKVGIDFMVDSAKESPLDVHIMIPSSVPSTKYETNGATIDVETIKSLRGKEGILGLGELMDYNGVWRREHDVLDKIEAMAEYPIDGHAPSLSGEALQAYRLVGVGTDHECHLASEAKERLDLGFYVHLREGSQTKNLLDVLPAINDHNKNHVLLCTDDYHPEDIVKNGHINHLINLAVSNGIDPIDAIRMGTIQIAECYGLKNKGAVAPGYRADLVVFNDLNHIEPEQVFIDGTLVAEEGSPLFSAKDTDPGALLNSVHVNDDDIDFSFPLSSNRIYAMELVKNNIVTKKTIVEVKLENKAFVFGGDLLKYMVIERHKNTGNVGKAIVKGYGLKTGAVGMTIAHDSHNMIVLGADDESMRAVVSDLSNIQGGIAIAKNGRVINHLSLEVGGIMTQKKPESVITRLNEMKDALYDMGVERDIEDPFLSLAFLSLPVVPELKCIDSGLFDVTKETIIPLEVDHNE